MLKVGRVSYTNTLPLFYSLRGFEIVEGHPSELVEKLRKGEIQAGIVSSAELFFNPESYYVLPDISISSRGRVCSVLLLSEKPLNRISRIKVTTRSVTSRYLLRYVLKEIHRRDFKEVPSKEEAILSIGDEALSLKDYYPFSYDLGEEWFRHTALPFVFALFLVRREVALPVARRLYRSVKESLTDFFTDLKRGKVKVFSDPDFNEEYFLRCIDYSLTKDHLRSLELFFGFLEKETGHEAPKINALFLPL